MKKSLLVFFVLLASSCATYYPERFMNVDQAFEAGIKPPAEASDAVKKSVFEASYVEVFRAATVSASQAQFNVESEDRKKGLIFATRSVVERPKDTTPYAPTPHIYFYAITLTELSPKKTEVSISARVQGRCMTESSLCVGAVTGGILVPMQMSTNAKCKRLSSGIWASGDYSTGQEFGQFLTFLRNNLIAAGAL